MTNTKIVQLRDATFKEMHTGDYMADRSMCSLSGGWYMEGEWTSFLYFWERRFRIWFSAGGYRVFSEHDYRRRAQ